MNDRSLHQIDAYVGTRLRLLRKLEGLTQSALAERLGVTFQQIQKYESGANRVSAGRLLQIATILRVPIGSFFDQDHEAPLTKSGIGTARDSSAVADFLSSSDGLQLNRSFLKIQDDRVRRSIVALVKAAANVEFASESPAGSPAILPSVPPESLTT